MLIFQTSKFAKQFKKLNHNQKEVVDSAIRIISQDIEVGELKKGDLKEIRVYKTKILDQLILIAYQVQSEQEKLILLALGSRENFYNELKRNLK